MSRRKHGDGVERDYHPEVVHGAYERVVEGRPPSPPRSPDQPGDRWALRSGLTWFERHDEEGDVLVCFAKGRRAIFDSRADARACRREMRSPRQWKLVRIRRVPSARLRAVEAERDRFERNAIWWQDRSYAWRAKAHEAEAVVAAARRVLDTTRLAGDVVMMDRDDLCCALRAYDVATADPAAGGTPPQPSGEAAAVPANESKEDAALRKHWQRIAEKRGRERDDYMATADIWRSRAEGAERQRDVLKGWHEDACALVRTTRQERDAAFARAEAAEAERDDHRRDADHQAKRVRDMQEQRDAARTDLAALVADARAFADRFFPDGKPRFNGGYEAPLAALRARIDGAQVEACDHDGVPAERCMRCNLALAPAAGEPRAPTGLLDHVLAGGTLRAPDGSTVKLSTHTEPPFPFQEPMTATGVAVVEGAPAAGEHPLQARVRELQERAELAEAEATNIHHAGATTRTVLRLLRAGVQAEAVLQETAAKTFREARIEVRALSCDGTAQRLRALLATSAGAEKTGEGQS